MKNFLIYKDNQKTSRKVTPKKAFLKAKTLILYFVEYFHLPQKTQKARNFFIIYFRAFRGKH